MKRFLLRIQTYLRKLAGVPVGDEMPLPQSDIEKSLYEICKNNPNGIMPGVQPSGTIPITENGTYDVAEFAEANVEVEVEEPQGLVDLVVNYTSQDSKTIAAVIDSNEVKNYTTSNGNMPIWIPLRKPFTLNTGDIITIDLTNVNNPGLYWDIGLIKSYTTTAVALPLIQIIENKRIVNGQTSFNYAFDPIPVFGIKVSCRSNISGGNLKIGLAINGETLF